MNAEHDYIVPCDGPGCRGGYVGLRICDKCLGAGRIWISVNRDLRRARIINVTLGILAGIAAGIIIWIVMR